ncbi:MAG: SDR family NAD(P)-dependent oxidoreductase, partial [Chloroflexota bacterium]
MDLGLGGKVAIVTGGSRGIGKAIALELASEGADVALVSRTLAPLQSTAAELATATGRAVVAFAADTGSDVAVQVMVAAVMQRFGRIDVLVNCAAVPGTTVALPLDELSEPPFHEQMNVKVLGYLRCIREVAPHMIAAGGGRIVSISGMAARQPISIIGSTRNAAVVAMTKAVAVQLAPHGIAVNVVHPGSTLTERYDAQVREAMASQGISRAEAERRRFDPNLIGRVVVPKEVAQVVAFLASARAAAITGEVIATAGGTPGVIHY